MRRSARWISTGIAAIALLVGAVATFGHYRQSQVASVRPLAAGKDIIDVATGPNMEQVTTVVAAIKAAGLVDTLKRAGPFTVFAPTNETFAELPPGTVDDLLKPENKEKLKSILLYHVHAGDAIMAKDVKTMDLSTANGKAIKVTVDVGTVMLNNAKVIMTDVSSSNGVINWIDTVVLP